MVYKLDAGDVIVSSKTPICPDMNFGELEQRLMELSCPLLMKALQMYEHGSPQAAPQDESAVTLAPKIEPEEALIDWRRPAHQLHNLIRGFSPRPGAWTWMETGGGKKRLKILRACLTAGHGAPGALLSKEGIVACGQGAIELLQVQPEGKSAMKASDFFRGQKNVSFVICSEK
jgi:methionyl-tRNA formyltransferase